MFALGGLLIAPGLHAETDLTELPLEQLMQVQVSSASKYAQPASEAPASMSVITAADIKAYGWRTLADILRSLPGLYTTMTAATPNWARVASCAPATTTPASCC